jgi:CheY-like chemotaxis protein
MERQVRIAVVEDDASVRALLVRALRKERPADRIEAFDRADKALDHLEATGWQWDLVITDMRMPGMDGLTLLRAIKRGAPTLPVIVLTAVRDDAYIQSCYEEGASDYIAKPVRVRMLNRLVSDALARRAALEGEDPFRIDLPVRGWMELTAGSRKEYLERLRLFADQLYGTALDDQTKFQLRMAVDELGGNAVEWGNRGDPRKRLRIDYVFFPDQVVVRIRDEGEGFQVAQLEDPTLDPLAHLHRRQQSGKRLGGYGVFLIRKLMDKVIYNDRGNEVVLTKYLPRVDAGREAEKA